MRVTSNKVDAAEDDKCSYCGKSLKDEIYLTCDAVPNKKYCYGCAPEAEAEALWYDNGEGQRAT